MKGEEAPGVRIKETIDRLPGGLMLAPLLLGALCKTFAPGAPAYFKGFTQGIMTGVIPILAVWFFCMGSSIKLSATGTVLRKSGTLVLTKFFAAWAIVLVASQFIPPEGVQSGFFAGLSILAIVCAVDMTNGGLYASLMQTYGTKEEAGAFVLTSIEFGPLMSMIILGASGAAHFEPQVFVGAVLPFLVGFALGNLDPKLREFFAPGGQLMIPFFAFALGNTIDLHSLLSPLAGLGVVLGPLRHHADRRPAHHCRQADRTGHGHSRHRRFLHRRGGGREPCGDCGGRSAICACGAAGDGAGGDLHRRHIDCRADPHWPLVPPFRPGHGRKRADEQFSACAAVESGGLAKIAIFAELSVVDAVVDSVAFHRAFGTTPVF